ncbi:MAG: hypothetical protein AB2L18_11045 [Anaerolineaceae bacterium]
MNRIFAYHDLLIFGTSQKTVHGYSLFTRLWVTTDERGKIKKISSSEIKEVRFQKGKFLSFF